MQFDIRPFYERDRSTIVEIDNYDLPLPRRYTAQDWALEDAEREPQEVALRLVVGDPAIAFLEVRDMSTTPPGFRSVPGVCELTLIVAHNHRRRGIGSALYSQALLFAATRHAHLMRAWFYQYSPDEPALSFLRRRGFNEQSRRQTSHLNIMTFDPSRFTPLLLRVARQGVKFVAYAELPDTLAHRRKLFALYRLTGFQQSDTAFDEWARASLDHVDWSSEALLLAIIGDEWVGMTRMAVYNQTTGTAKITATGTTPEYRGRGIATALKVRAVELLRSRGGTIILTSNRVDNVEMLAVNRNLGYVPGPLELTWDCPLPPEPMVD
jgi:GNAT superfamily N-acetyltransferase